jgi:transposase
MGRRKKASKKASADTAESAAATGGGVRGRKADPVETARRVAVLKRVEGGEISNNQAADELGLKIGTWAVWKSNYLKRQGGGKAKAKAAKAAKPAKAAKAPKAKRGDALKAARAAKAAKAAKAASTGAPSLAGLQDLVAHLQGVQEFGQALKAQLQQLADLVERQFPS